jgi:hypothetical protein
VTLSRVSGLASVLIFGMKLCFLSCGGLAEP